MRRRRVQVDEPKTVRQAQAGFGVPAGPIEQQDDHALWACAGLAGEQRQQALEEWLGDAVADVWPSPVAGATKAVT